MSQWQVGGSVGTIHIELNSVGLWLLGERGTTGARGVWHPGPRMAGGYVTVKSHNQAKGRLRCLVMSMRTQGG